MTRQVKGYRWKKRFGKLNMYTKIIVLGDFTTIWFSCTYVLSCVYSHVTSIWFSWRYRHSFIVKAANLGSFTCPTPGRFIHFPIPLVSHPGSFRSFKCLLWVILDHCCNPLPHVASPINRLMFKSVWHDVHISVYSSLHCIEKCIITSKH